MTRLSSTGPVQSLGRTCTADEAGAYEVPNGDFQEKLGGVCHQTQVRWQCMLTLLRPLEFIPLCCATAKH